MKKKVLTIVIAVCALFTNTQTGFSKSNTTIIASSNSSINIKIKNDTGEAFTVINAGSGGTYTLSKNTVVTIKMDEGDKLFVYEKGKKGALLLVAKSEMENKVQLVSKL